jgi:hypothetical protein
MKNFSESKIFGDREDDRLDLTHVDPVPPSAGCRCSGGGTFCGSRANEVNNSSRPICIYGADCNVLNLYYCASGTARAVSRGRCAEDACVRSVEYGGDYCNFGRVMTHNE